MTMTREENDQQQQDNEQRERECIDALEWFWNKCIAPASQAKPYFFTLLSECGIDRKHLDELIQFQLED